MKINQIKKNILKVAKPIIVRDGWNQKLFINIEKLSKYKIEEIKLVFPEGKNSLLQTYLDEINDKTIKGSKKIDLIRMRTHERIRVLIILRLKIMLEEKKLISKTFLYLLLPHNYKVASKNLYKTIDLLWFLSGDNSTDFNFYSKRAILGTIYANTMVNFTNNDDFENTINFLDRQLKEVSKIPRLKERMKDVIKLIPKILKIRKSIFSKQ